MTCERCGHKEVFFQETPYISRCPACENLDVLSKEESLKLIAGRYRDMDKLFVDYIGNFEKTNLIIWLAAYREKLASEFITETPALILDEFLSANTIIKEVMEKHKGIGSENANEEDIKELLSWYLQVIYNKELQLLIEEDFVYLIRRPDSSSDHPVSEELFRNFEVAYDEDWIVVIESYKQNLIMPRDIAEKYVNENKEKYERNKTTSKQIKEYTPEETIHSLYPLLLSFKIGLTKNSLFAETFNFNYLEKKEVLIDLFLKLTGHFYIEDKALPIIPVEGFKQFLREKFAGLDQDRLYSDLVFSYDNKDTFPFFIELKNVPVTTEESNVEHENGIIVSKSFLKILKIFYYPFYYDDLFNSETQALSDQFAKIDVPKKFHEKGFNIRISVEKKSKKSKKLEIDTIAWNNDRLYVIETKIWDVTKLFEQRQTHSYRERDLKGVVDGFKYTNRCAIEKPSLIRKIDYVKHNFKEVLSKYKETIMFPDHDIIDNNITSKEIIGMIITKSFPPIKEYKGVMMIGFEEIKGL